jgi:hypothetical protein
MGRSGYGGLSRMNKREVPMFQPMLARGLAVSSALLALTVFAQTPTTAPTQARPGEYRSVFEGYQPYGESKMVPWKEANDTVGQIGGWRAYAKEAAEGQGHRGHAPAAGAPKPAASQAKP